MQNTYARILSDTEIIDLYWARDEIAIQRTDEKYRAYLLTVANNILRDIQDSEECLNDTYLSAWNTIPPERPYLLKAYLATIMRNLCLMVCRKQNTLKRASLSQAVSLSDLEDVLTDHQDSEQSRTLTWVIEQFLDGITKDQRYIFLGRYYFGKTIEQVADELGVSRSTVNKQIAYLKQALKQKLKEEGIGV